MSKIIFTDDIGEIKKGEYFLAEIKKSPQSSYELFEILDKKLMFDNFFGYNWDALFDEMRNLEWINQYCIIIYHCTLKDFPAADLLTYIKVINFAISDLEKSNHRRLVVVFNNVIKKEFPDFDFS